MDRCARSVWYYNLATNRSSLDLDRDDDTNRSCACSSVIAYISRSLQIASQQLTVSREFPTLLHNGQLESTMDKGRIGSMHHAMEWPSKRIGRCDYIYPYIRLARKSSRSSSVGRLRVRLLQTATIPRGLPRLWHSHYVYPAGATVCVNMKHQDVWRSFYYGT